MSVGHSRGRRRKEKKREEVTGRLTGDEDEGDKGKAVEDIGHDDSTFEMTRPRRQRE